MSRPTAKNQYIDQIRRLAGSGASISEIATEVGVPASNVRRWAAEESIDLMSARDKRRQDAIQMYREGSTIAEVEAATGVPASSVQRYVSQAGISRPQGNTSRRAFKKERNLERVLALHAEGKSVYEIAALLPESVSYQSVGRWISQENLTPDYGMKDHSVAKAKAERRQGAVQRLRDGEKATDIAADLGVAATTVYRWAGVAGMEFTPRGKKADPSKKRIFTCQNCGEEATRYKAARTAFKYCSSTCAEKHTRTKEHIILEDGTVLDSKWEALFIGVMSMLNINCERHKRDLGVTWGEVGHWYAPDFYLPTDELYVEVKGVPRPGDPVKWAAFREQVGPLAVLDRDGLNRLRTLDREDAIEYLYRLAEERA